MDFFNLFDPSEGNQKQKKKHKEQETVKKKTEGKGRRRGRKSSGKHETLPEESSFLCEPGLSSDLLVKDSSYIEDFFELTRNDDDNKTEENKPKRRNSGRKSRRRKKISPSKEDVLNNRSTKPKLSETTESIGKNVNNLKTGENHLKTDEKCHFPKSYNFSDNSAYKDKPIYNVIDKLEKVSLKDDMYLAGDFNTEDLESDFFYCSDDEEYIDDSTSDDYDSSEEIHGSLPPEPRFGNVEYKLRLSSLCEKRFQHLVTQLKWRLRSGGGRCVYVVGVSDCGRLRGLRARALRGSLRALARMAAALPATIVRVAARRVAPARAVAEVHITKLADPHQSVELRIAVLGANEAGKSTLIGVLTQGELDNGHGSARLNMFRHQHEVKTGMTSSLSHEILGFDAQGNVVNYGCSELMTAERIGERSAKLVAFLDLAGHSKYQRTTLHGLTGYSPHYAMLCISATAGITAITEEHLGLLIALKLPFFVVISKCELASAAVTPLVKQLAGILADHDKEPLLITDENLARNCCAPEKSILDSLDEETQDDNISARTVPVFPVSSARGCGLAALHAHLLALQPPPRRAAADLDHETCEFQIDEIFHVGDGGGAVVGGLLARGALREGDALLLGPLCDGSFARVRVSSVYRNRVPAGRARAGQPASLTLHQPAPPVRPGMVLLAIPEGYKTGDRPTWGGCPPQHCKRKLEIQELIRSKQSPIIKNRKHKKHKNILKDLSLEDVLSKDIENNDLNIYKESDSDEYETQRKKIAVDNKKIDANHINMIVDDKKIDKDHRNIDVDDKNDADLKNIIVDQQKISVDDKKIGVDKNMTVDGKKIDDLSSQENVDGNNTIFKYSQAKPFLDNGNKDFDDVSQDEKLMFDEQMDVEDRCLCGDVVLLEDPNDPRGCIFFQASVKVLRHSTAIYPGFQCTVHVGNVRQTAIIEGIMSRNNVLRAGETASVVFRFVRCPEYLVRGRQLLFTAGLGTRGTGRISQIFPYVP